MESNTWNEARRVYEFLSPGERSAETYDYNWSGIWRGENAGKVSVAKFGTVQLPRLQSFLQFDAVGRVSLDESENARTSSVTSGSSTNYSRCSP